MPNLVPGMLWFQFAIAILLTTVLSSVVLVWYRRAVSHSMRTASHDPLPGNLRFAGDTLADAHRWPDPTAPSRAPYRPSEPIDMLHPREAARTAWPYERLRTRLVAIYGLAGLTAAAVMAAFTLYDLGDEVRVIRTFLVIYTYCWPIVPTLSFLLVVPRTRALLAFGSYVLIGATIAIAWSLVARYVLGRADVVPWQNAVSFLQLLAVNAWLPYAIILLTSGRRMRSVAPVVLAGLLVFSFSNLAVANVMIRAFDIAAIRNTLLAFGFRAAWYGPHMLAAIPVGYLCWQGLRWLARQFERKVFSDAQLLVDAWWLIIAFQFASEIASSLGWNALFALTAFVAYRLVVAAGLALWCLDDARLGNRRLLLLRVFGFQRRTEKLFDTVAQRWRFVGSIKMIAGTDLATRLIGPGDLIAFVGGRLQQLFVRPDGNASARLRTLDERRDPDGRFRISKVYCYDDTWRPALQALLGESDVVLMDLRGFSASNSGCLFELQQLVENRLLHATIFLVDDTTDTNLLTATLSDQARKADGPPLPPLNLISAGSGSTRDSAKVYDRLLALSDGRGVAAAAS